MGINQDGVLYAACQKRRGGHQPAYVWLSLPKKACGFPKEDGPARHCSARHRRGQVLIVYPGFHLLGKPRKRIRGFQSPLKLLFAVSVVPNKGLHLLIDEMGQLHTQLVVLDVLGNPDEGLWRLPERDVAKENAFWEAALKAGFEFFP